MRTQNRLAGSKAGPARFFRRIAGESGIISVRAIWAAPAFGFLIPAAADAAPLQYLSGAGVKATPVVWLTWGVLLISILVTAAIVVLLVAAIWHRPGLRMAIGERTALEKDEGGYNWLWIGVGLSALALLITVVWTVKVLASIQAPGARPEVTIEITGRQWWWQARYITDDPVRAFATANEIHIPVGQPIRLKLVGGDVIHSFWVPQLAGKMDAIPGQTNETWIEASAPGDYMGQCTEYCGVQHAKMQVRVIAEESADFRAWQAHQLAAPTSGDSGAFVAHCGRCHTVRGTEANGTFGPDLSHLMQRRTLIATGLPNDETVLSHWISDPQSLKPGNQMPAVKLSAQDHDRIVAWLRTLN
jgi:cytochrome c oxidase subunit 2